MSWQYRIGEVEPGLYAMVEIYLDDEGGGEIWGWTLGDVGHCEDMEELRATIAMMAEAAALPPIDHATLSNPPGKCPFDIPDVSEAVPFDELLRQVDGDV